MSSENARHQESSPESGEKSLQSTLNSWLEVNKKRRRLMRWVFDRWVYSRRKKRCVLRRLMCFPKQRKFHLRKVAAHKFAHKKVTRVEKDMDAWCNVWGYRLTYGGIQTRTLTKAQAKRCEEYANLTFNCSVMKYVNENDCNVLCDSIFWRNNCVDRNSSRGYCDECKELICKADIEIDDRE